MASHEVDHVMIKQHKWHNVRTFHDVHWHKPYMCSRTYRLLFQQVCTDLGLHNRGELAAVIEGNELISSMPGPYHPSKEEASKGSHKYSCGEVTQLLWKVITISTAACVWAHVHVRPSWQDHSQKIYKNHTPVAHDVVLRMPQHMMKIERCLDIMSNLVYFTE